MWAQGSNLADPLDAVSRRSIVRHAALSRCVQQGHYLANYPTNNYINSYVKGVGSEHDNATRNVVPLR